MTLREVLRKNAIIHGLISGLYRNTFYLFRTGYVRGIISYNVNTRFRELKKLKNEGFISITPFSKRSWKFGGGYDHAYRRYYTGFYNGRKVFIKIAKNDSTIKNEIELGIHLKPYHIPFICEEEYYNYNFDSDGTSMLASDYIDNLSPFIIPDSYESFSFLCNDYLELLKELSHCGVVHADIHRNNLMMKSDGKLVLLDFGISKILNKNNNVDYIARPGTYYQTYELEGRQYRIYDDAYSFCCLVESLDIPMEWLEVEEYQEIKSRIGEIQFSIQIS